MKKFLILFFLFFSISDFSQAKIQNFLIRNFEKKISEQVYKKYASEDLLKILAAPPLNGEDMDKADDNLKIYIFCEQLRAGQTWAADALFKKISEKIPEDLRFYYRARLAIEMGKPDLGIADLKIFSEKYPNDPDGLILMGLVAVLRQDYIVARDFLSQAVVQDPKNGKIYLQRGLVFSLSLSHELAYQDFLKALKLLPKGDLASRQTAELQAGIIQMKYFLNDRRAKKHFERGIALDPNSLIVADFKEKMAQ